jgi:hypothetical protein
MIDSLRRPARPAPSREAVTRVIAEAVASMLSEDSREHWPKPAPSLLSGADDGRARRRIFEDREHYWQGRPLAVGRENRQFCDGFHRGRWPA